METAVKKISTSPFGTTERLPFVKGIAILFMAVRKFAYRITHWETWDWRIKYFIIAPAWFWFCLRARSLWFFTTSNPTLTFGGFDGESKKEIYEQLPVGSYPESLFISLADSIDGVKKLLEIHSFPFPFVVKPDVGKMGLMFRVVNSLDELENYHRKIHCSYIIQKLVTYPLEVSVFYYRFPGAQKGTITGFIRKEFLDVTGDGISTLWQLICRYPRVQFRLEEMRLKHKHRLNDVLPAGHVYCLSHALNLSRGGKLVSLEHEKDERLLKVFDELSHHTRNFYYGRYDIRCQSIEHLKQGRDYYILEYNGSGAEPHHVYGNGYTLWEACAILVSHWKRLYEISVANRKKGNVYWTFRAGWNFFRKTSDHLKQLQKIDSETAIT
jgi:hypothetical protein